MSLLETKRYTMNRQTSNLTNQNKRRILNLFLWRYKRELNEMHIEDHKAKFIRERIYNETGYLISISLIKKHLKDVT